MYSLLAPLIGVGFSIAIHVIAWRMIRPQSPVRLLPPAAVAGAAIVACLASVRTLSPSVMACVEAAFLFLSMIACYLISLPALESDSPSSMIVNFVHRCGTAGATRQQLEELINDDLFVINRIQGLEVEGLVERTGDTLRITPAGLRFLDAFMVYHRIVGRRAKAE